MEYFGIDLSTLIEKGAVHTAREINQQPDLWMKVIERVLGDREEIRSFIETSTSNPGRIILTGAGSSAFIGLSLAGIFQRKTQILTEVIATTDLVSHPKNYFHSEVPTLMISFARSGNSPESVAAVALADELCKKCFHLIITCNADGLLAKCVSKNEKFVFTLPAEANDQSLVMTSSYTGMLLAGILIANLDDLESARRSVDILAGYGRRTIDHYAEQLAKIAEVTFGRAVFLGSGPLFGTARESHLKLQELTDGLIICKEDSFLGFRHGPKAVVDDNTLVVYNFSNEEYVSRYERDLVHSMKKGKTPRLEIGIMEHRMPGMDLDHVFYFSDNGRHLTEEYLAVCSVLPSQILGFYKALQLGMRPDTPSATGAITRVVEGVHIYDLEG